MPTLANDLVSAPLAVNQRLLGTALAGLLCLATAGCSDNAADRVVVEKGTPETAGSSGTGATGASGMPGSAGGGATGAGGSAGESAAAGSPASGGTSSVGGTGGGSSAEGGTASGSGGVSDAAGTGGSSEVAGAGGAAAEPPHITSSKAAGVLTVDDFKALCDERGGTVEVMPHCGGFATAKGFSYDSGTQLLSEHTCMGSNTCAGWNCAIVD